MFVIQVVQRWFRVPRVYQEARQHRVEVSPPEFYSHRAEAAQVGLKVVARFWRTLLCKQRGGCRDKFSAQNMGFSVSVKLEAGGASSVAQQCQRNALSVPQFVENFADLCRAQRRFAARSHGQFDLARTDFLQHRGEFQIAHELCGSLLVDTSPCTTFGRHIEGHVGMYPDQSAGKFDVRAMLLEQCRDLCTASNSGRR